MAKFCMGRKAHVFLSRKTVTVKCLGPWMTLAGKHWSTTVPHCHTQAATWLDKTERKINKMLHNENKNI